MLKLIDQFLKCRKQILAAREKAAKVARRDTAHRYINGLTTHSHRVYASAFFCFVAAGDRGRVPVRPANMDAGTCRAICTALRAILAS